MAVASGRDKVFKLFARGTELDLFQDETIFLSNNVTGLFDLGKLPSDFTRQIMLPGTKKNNDFFQHVYDISIDEPFLFKTNEKVIAQFDLDGFYVAQGYMQLEKVNLRENKFVESYEVSVFGLLSSFKRDLQSITLNEVSEFDKYNHIFSIGNIANSWSGSSYTGTANATWGGNSIFTSSVDGHNLGGEIVYCLQDGGKQLAFQSALPANMFGIDNRTGPFDTPDGSEIRAQNFKPAMRLDKIIDAIFDETEYSYESTFLSESRFDNTYILLDRGLRFPIIDGTDLETAGQIEVGPVSGSSTPLTLTSGVSASLLFTDVYHDPSFSIIDANGTYSPFWGSSVPASSPSQAEITLNILVSGAANPTNYPEFYLFPDMNSPNPNFTDGIDLPYINDYIRRDFKGSSGEKEYTLTQEIPKGFSFSSGSEYDFGIGFRTLGGGSLNVTIGPGGNAESRIKINSLVRLGELSTINIADNMPYGTNGITLLDFLASIQKKFNLQIYPSKTKPRHFIIETFNNWYKQGETKNFDKFVDLNKPLTVTPANNLGVREVEFGDTLDLDFLAQDFNKKNNREYGKSYFRDTQNFFSEGKLEVKTGLGVSPIRYVAGSGKEGSAVVRLTAFQTVLGNSTTAICSSTTSTFYHNGTGSFPAIGDTVYFDVDGNTPATLNQYMLEDVGPGVIYELNPATATVIDDSFGTCGGGGGPTS